MDRFFRNEMPDYASDTAGKEVLAAGETLKELLFLPYHSFSDRLKRYGLELKERVVRETWLSSGKPVKDCTIYTGTLGTAYLVFMSYQVTKNQTDLKLCSEIVKACDSASRDLSRVTFLVGRAGVCALGAVLAKQTGDERLLGLYLSHLKQIRFPNDIPDELLYGRAGYLWACQFINKYVGKNTVSAASMRSVLDDIISSGRRLGRGGKCPLMYEWHGKKYWGAAHGLAGIMYVLMNSKLKPDENEDVKGTLLYMIKNRFPSGNYPSSEGSESDRLVHWCHGAPGLAITFVKAAEVFGTEEFLKAAVEAGEVVWKRGLLKRVGMCHGISGNTYVFLSLYRLTGRPEYLYRAKAFAAFLFDKAERLISEGAMAGGDRPFSLFEGIGGMAYMFLDMNEPSSALFPGYEF